ncbi:hypothetical protein QZM22_21550 [Burkholderia oklahomensis]|uniref:hypothetical protein n=1 Tax=Burkholderia oklahomensis TaxID=342113 RepID=UPI00264DDE1B|nr:hypothetical protein [Burkholderia oklahomensis]MDN7675036.1 hypothetical protein [Burkholderia oklahomensis]
MKKQVIGAVSATLFGAAATAHAQSSVTLYGLLEPTGAIAAPAAFIKTIPPAAPQRPN